MITKTQRKTKLDRFSVCFTKLLERLLGEIWCMRCNTHFVNIWQILLLQKSTLEKNMWPIMQKGDLMGIAKSIDPGQPAQSKLFTIGRFSVY